MTSTRPFSRKAAPWRQRRALGLVDCGFAQPDHPIHIAGPDGSCLPDGAIGEVVASGPSLAQGYWRNRDATDAAFVERDGIRSLRTGDLGFLHGGRIFLVGREKDLIILRGQNVYPAGCGAGR